MKFGQLTEYNKINIFLQDSCRKWGRETSSRPFFVFKKAIYEVKASALQLAFTSSALQFQYISIALNLANNKNKMYKTPDYWSKDMLNFDFSKKGLGLVSPPHFVHDFFSRKVFSNWPSFFVWLPSLREILGSMCIAIVCLPGCDVINFEINLIFLAVFLQDQKVMTKI